MSERGNGMFGRKARFVWGGIALLLLGALIATFPLSRASIERAEGQAEARAEELAGSVVLPDLTPELLSGDIGGTGFRDLLARVQAGILSDDRIARVRIWRPDGDLIFSSIQGDDVYGPMATDDPAIQHALQDGTVSRLSAPSGRSEVGLRDPDEQLFETFVPLRPDGQLSNLAVAEIGQRYSAVRAEALTVWRPLQIALAVLVPVTLILLVVSIGRSVGSRRDAGGGTARSAAGKELRRAEERAARAERAARDAEQRAADLEGRLRKEREERAERPPEALEEIGRELEGSRAAREELEGQVEHLRAALSEKESELARALEAVAGIESESRAAHELIEEADRMTREADRRAVDAEGRVAESERIAVEASERAAAAAARVGELEALLVSAERKAAEDAQDEASAKSQQGGDKRLVAELKKVRSERDELKERELAAERRAATSAEELAQVKDRLAESEMRLAEMEQERVAVAAEAGLPATTDPGRAPPADGSPDLEARIVELEIAHRANIEELQHVQRSLANTQFELTTANRKLKDAEARVRELEGGTAARAGERGDGPRGPEPVSPETDPTALYRDLGSLPEVGSAQEPR